MHILYSPLHNLDTEQDAQIRKGILSSDSFFIFQ